MGSFYSFTGHVAPGSFFCCVSMWWMYNIFYRYYCARRFRKSYRNISSFPCSHRNQCPTESLLKVAMAGIGITGEFVTGFEDGKWSAMGNAHLTHHITMYVFFGLTGIVELLQHKKWDLPPKLDYVSATIAFSVEAFLFYFHLHGRSPLNVMVHMFLFYAVVGCVLSTVVEMNSTNVNPALSRVFFTLLQGTWFLQIGFILHPPHGDPWDGMRHEQMMVATVLFTCHILGVLIAMFIMGTLVYVRVQNLPDSFANSLYEEGVDIKGKDNSFGKEDSQPLYLSDHFNSPDTNIDLVGSEGA